MLWPWLHHKMTSHHFKRVAIHLISYSSQLGSKLTPETPQTHVPMCHTININNTTNKSRNSNYPLSRGERNLARRHHRSPMPIAQTTCSHRAAAPKRRRGTCHNNRSRWKTNPKKQKPLKNKNSGGWVGADLRIWTTFEGLRASGRAGEGELISTPTSRIQEPRSKTPTFFFFPLFWLVGPNRYYSDW